MVCFFVPIVCVCMLTFHAIRLLWVFGICIIFPFQPLTSTCICITLIKYIRMCLFFYICTYVVTFLLAVLTDVCIVLSYVVDLHM